MEKQVDSSCVNKKSIKASPIRTAAAPNTPSRSWYNNYSTQELFLDQCIGRKKKVDLLLKNDSVRCCRILAYDNWALLVEADFEQGLIFKSAIMAIMPSGSERSRQHYTKAGASYLADIRAQYMHNPTQN